MKHRLKLAKQYYKLCIYMLERNPSSEHWNTELKMVNKLIRTLK